MKIQGMYPFIKVNKNSQSKVFNFFIITLSFLCFMWFVLSGLELELQSTVLVRNADYIEGNATARKVAHVNSSGKVFTESQETFEDSDISEYVHVPMERGTYVVMNEDYKYIMSVELTQDECVDMAKKFLILDWLIFAILLLLRYTLVSKESVVKVLKVYSKLIKIGLKRVSWYVNSCLLVLTSMFSWIVLSYWYSEILDKNPKILWCLLGRVLIVFAVEVLIKCLVTRRKNGK